jgi:hypothetical protein
MDPLTKALHYGMARRLFRKAASDDLWRQGLSDSEIAAIEADPDNLEARILALEAHVLALSQTLESISQRLS